MYCVSVHLSLDMSLFGQCVDVVDLILEGGNIQLPGCCCWWL